MKNEIKELVDDIHTHLKYQKMMGIEEVPKCVSAEVHKLKTDKQSSTQTLKHSNTQTLLDEIKQEIGDCKRCKLCKGRTHIVFGVGNPNAKLMFIGEGPGADEDAQGEPFVGRAGQLLTKIIIAMGYKREDVYIGNIVKCRPPNNRNPEPDEMETCMPFILKQISEIKPKIIVTLGAIATKAFLNTEIPISKMRGKLLDWEPKTINWSFSSNLIFWDEKKIEPLDFDKLPSCKLIPTYHPAFLLRNPNMKRPVWEDMQVVMKELSNYS